VPILPKPSAPRKHDQLPGVARRGAPVRTRSGYEVVVGQLARRPFIAILGRNGWSLPAVVFDQALRLLRAGGPGAEVAGAILTYLAAIGARPLCKSRKPPLRWPVVGRDGRRRLKQLYVVLDPLTLKRGVEWGPRADERPQRLRNAADTIELATYAEQSMPAEFPVIVTERVRRAVRKRVLAELRGWLTAGRRDASGPLQALLKAHAARGEVEHLAALQQLAEFGRRLYYRAIQQHQQLALAEAASVAPDPRVAEALTQGCGLHALLYRPQAEFGFESWQCRLVASARVRVYLPELVWYGRQRLGDRWLTQLLAAAAIGDAVTRGQLLQELHPILEALAAHRLVGQPTKSLFSRIRTREGSREGFIELDAEGAPKPATAHPEAALVARLTAEQLPACAGLSPAEAALYAARLEDPDLSLAEYAREHGRDDSTVKTTASRLRQKGRKVV
jgi:hypothetical protein